MRIAQPTPELPVPDVAAAQDYYRERMGFRVEWHNKEGGIGAVSHGDCAIFFRETKGDIHPGTFWIFTENVDDAFLELGRLGADIVEPIDNKPWGMRQFTVRDLCGNVFYFHHDI
ncbi:VOC family protein [Bauldia sp.]|uniref:VOC family protein n=1 Tax=Bauldia sp. TaxID=2575872 RepID=UPI003BAA7AF5